MADQFLKELLQLKHLEWLDLSRTAASDSGMKQLARMNQLRWLKLEGTGVTDAGLQALTTIQLLESLDLKGTRVSDAGLRHLSTLKSLKSLNLSDTSVSDAGMKELAAMKQLNYLDLSGAQITDAGLKELSTPPEKLADAPPPKYSHLGLVNRPAAGPARRLRYCSLPEITPSWRRERAPLPLANDLARVAVDVHGLDFLADMVQAHGAQFEFVAQATRTADSSRYGSSSYVLAMR